MSKQIVLVKLITGEEIIGSFVEDVNSQLVLLEQVLKIVFTGRELAITSFFASHPEHTGTIPFMREHILAIVTPPEHMLKAYVQQTSGLDLSLANL